MAAATENKPTATIENLSYGDLMELLSRTLNADPDGGTGPDDTLNRYWVRDVFTDKTFIYSDATDYSLYKASYTLSKDNRTVKIGEPTQVVSRTVYDTVFTLDKEIVSGSVTFGDNTTEYVIRRGLIFEAGNYPDKNFSLTPEEMQEAVRDFRPCPVDYQHVEGPLDGHLGKLVKVEVSEDGQKLFGEVALPKWLDALFQNVAMKVSCTWDMVDKRLKRLALVNSPRITDAALYSAFTADFAGRRHSKEDMARLKQVHTIIVGLLGNDPNHDGDNDATENETTEDEPTATMAGSYFTQATQAETEKEKEKEGINSMPTTTNNDKTESQAQADFAAMQTQMADLMARLASVEGAKSETEKKLKRVEDERRFEKEQNRVLQAAQFSERALRERWVFGAEQAGLLTQFFAKLSQVDEKLGEVAFAEFGNDKQPHTLVEALTKFMEARPAHEVWFGEMLATLPEKTRNVALMSASTPVPASKQASNARAIEIGNTEAEMTQLLAMSRAARGKSN